MEIDAKPQNKSLNDFDLISLSSFLDILIPIEKYRYGPSDYQSFQVCR